jgi:hypothetical protein
MSEHLDKHPKDTKRLIGIDYQSLQQLIGRAELEKERLQSNRTYASSVILRDGALSCVQR